jgi:hypothetical protein
MIKAIGNGVKVKGWEMIGWFGLLNYREAVSYILIPYHNSGTSFILDINTILDKSDFYKIVSSQLDSFQINGNILNISKFSNIWPPGKVSVID